MAISNNQFDKSKFGKRKSVISDINITPFVDVLLVLLIIFMVCAPMMTGGMNLSLPNGAQEISVDNNNPISISIKSDGEIFVNDEVIKINNLTSKIISFSSNNFNKKIMVRADKSIDYGKVMEVVRIINVAGFSQVALVTELMQ